MKQIQREKDLKEEIELIFDQMELNVFDTNKHPDCKYYITEDQQDDLKKDLVALVSKVRTEEHKKIQTKAEELSKRYCLLGVGLDDCNSCLPLQRLLEDLNTK